MNIIIIIRVMCINKPSTLHNYLAQKCSSLCVCSDFVCMCRKSFQEIRKIIPEFSGEIILLLLCGDLLRQCCQIRLYITLLSVQFLLFDILVSIRLTANHNLLKLSTTTILILYIIRKWTGCSSLMFYRGLALVILSYKNCNYCTYKCHSSSFPECQALHFSHLSWH